eukprot:GDKK01069712.1.p1 GENE.GDKK01069712.1~~GDKK01069712.1.p1  ORF type:complete len:183 (-),score=21.33 GDKK01069712.1:108-656(-)
MGANISNNGGMRSSLFGGPRRGAGNASSGGSSGPSPNSNNNNRHEDEEAARHENEIAMDGLASDMTRLRKEAQYLRGEVADQNKLIDTVQGFMLGAKDGMVGTVHKLDATMKTYGVKHTLLFAIAMCGAFFVALYLIKGMLFGPSIPANDQANAALNLATAAAKGILAPDPPIEAPPAQLAN